MSNRQDRALRKLPGTDDQSETTTPVKPVLSNGLSDKLIRSVVHAIKIVSVAASFFFSEKKTTSQSPESRIQMAVD